jgi:hypothetical protein
MLPVTSRAADLTHSGVPSFMVPTAWCHGCVAHGPATPTEFICHAAHGLQATMRAALVPPHVLQAAFAGLHVQKSQWPPVGHPHKVQGGRTFIPMSACCFWMCHAKAWRSSGLSMRSMYVANWGRAMGHRGKSTIGAPNTSEGKPARCEAARGVWLVDSPVRCETAPVRDEANDMPDAE